MKRLLAAGAVGAVVLGIVALAPEWPGTWLVVEDPLEPAAAVVVLGGRIVERAPGAVAVHEQGRTREVWMTMGAAFERAPGPRPPVGEVIPERGHGVQLLEQLGVPGDEIRVLPGPSRNTADEVRAVVRQLQGSGETRVVLVTSKYHSRRVKLLWRMLAPSGLDAIVRHPPGDTAVPARWWRSSSDVRAVAHEWLGLVHAWVFVLPRSLLASRHERERAGTHMRVGQIPTASPQRSG